MLLAGNFETSFELRRPKREADRFSAEAPALWSLPGASDVAAIDPVSSLGELEALDEECFRWCLVGNRVEEGLAVRTWEVRDKAEHVTHVQTLLRAVSLIDKDSIVSHPVQEHGKDGQRGGFCRVLNGDMMSKVRVAPRQKPLTRFDSTPPPGDHGAKTEIGRYISKGKKQLVYLPLPMYHHAVMLYEQCQRSRTLCDSTLSDFYR